MTASFRHGALAAAALILSACPALLEDDFEAVEGSGGASGTAPGAGAAGDGGEATGVAGAAPAAPAGGSLGDAGRGGVAGAGATAAGGAPSGGASGMPSGGGGGVPMGGAAGTPSGGTSGVGGEGGAAGSSGSPGGSAGRGAAGGSWGGGGTGAGADGGAATGGAGGLVRAGAGGEGGGEAGAGGAGEPLCATSPADCEVLLESLLHRYRFDGTGTTVTDSVGGADGVVRGGAALEGTGELVLDGGSSGQYVDLPNGLISSLEDATLELWVRWNGGVAWQRVFDFGDAMAHTCTSGGASAPEGQPGACGRTFLNLTPATEASAGTVPRVAFMRQPGDPTEDSLLVDGPRVTVGTELHLVVVVDDTEDELRFFVDGELGGVEQFVDHLADVYDINNWLGRSQFSSDADKYFGGVYRELRIYGTALGDSQVATSFAEGPDAPFLD